MFQDTYIKLDAVETQIVLDRINPSLQGSSFDPSNTVIMARDLSFYPGYRFLDIADHSTMPQNRRYVLLSEREITPLDFTNQPIYSLNASLPIQLNDDNIDDYVRFFFSYVRGRHGRFLITENVEDINWREDPPPSARKAVGKMLQPLQIYKTATGYELKGQMMFKDTLFQSDIMVEKDGTVALSNQQLLIENMPVLDDTLGQ